MAEVLLRHRLGLIDASVRVTSAGTHAGTHPATQHGQQVMAARGLDLSSHTSRRLDVPLIDGADLIVGMAREHVREVASLDPTALDRTFTLKELVGVATGIGPRRAGESLSEWLGRVGVQRRRADLVGIGHDAAFDIEDPVGRGLRDYEATAEEIDHLLAVLVERAWPAAAQEGRERSA